MKRPSTKNLPIEARLLPFRCPCRSFKDVKVGEEAMLELPGMQSAVLLGVVVASFWLVYKLSEAAVDPLRSVPGPTLARLSRVWYLSQVRRGNFEKKNIELHEQYGPIVRISPDHYSLADPAAIKQVYRINSNFEKSAWYEAWKHPAPEQWTTFADRNVKRHADTRRRLQGLYAMSSVSQYEKFVDQTTEVLLSRMDDLAGNAQTINMTFWLQYYAFDVIGNITFSTPFGFLEKGEDIDNILVALENNLLYSTLVGIFPEWHPRLFQWLQKLPGSGAGARVKLLRFVADTISIKWAEKAQVGDSHDFLDRLMEINAKEPEKVTEYHIFAMVIGNVFAGSDTTAVSLSAVVYNLIRNPNVMQKLRQQIVDIEPTGKITWKQSQSMPYLLAVIKEALRVHPATGLPLWRVTPRGGAQILDRFFPAGSVVGINTWTMHYNQDVFGPDAQTFRPERWLTADAETLKEMNASYMPFGLGTRTCLGRHISTLEMCKLVPRLVVAYDFALAKPKKEWNTSNFWFVRPTDFHVYVTKRKSER
ncbi:hypothetical protein LTR84_009982 [Exophiala bonariae]|uniref:Cytochrome P450 n=1 Tax=Exophiala bonariae TaxID=1690606 RepID=A0AAV9NNM0_9EURO|nr:hypothetical protein LTR84_009982 [Exophiala bonariae]